MANHPRHQANGIHTHADFPPGLGPENVDHEGFPERPLASGPGWNSVGGLVAMGHVMERLGGASVDFGGTGVAVGVDGVKIVACWRREKVIHLQLENPLAALPTPYGNAYVVELRITGLPAGVYQLVLNEQPPREIDAARLARFSIKIDPVLRPRGEMVGP